MRKTDSKDLKILDLLSQNCRLPIAAISRAVGLSKDATDYRIKKLEEDKIISHYQLFIDSRKLGFSIFHLLICFESNFPNRQQIYKTLSGHPNIMWINTFVGKFDIQIIIYAQDSFHFNLIRSQLFAICNNRIKNYSILSCISDYEFTQTLPELMLDTKVSGKIDVAFHPFITKQKFPAKEENFTKVELSYLDIMILQCLADNPKIAFSELSARLNKDRLTVKKHLARLIQNKVITHISAVIDVQYFGYVTYYFLVRHLQDTPQNILKKPFEKLNNIFYSGKMIGDYDMILYLNSKNPNELNYSIKLFRECLGNYILNYELLVQDEILFWKQYNNGVHALLKKKFP